MERKKEEKDDIFQRFMMRDIQKIRLVISLPEDHHRKVKNAEHELFIFDIPAELKV